MKRMFLIGAIVGVLLTLASSVAIFIHLVFYSSHPQEKSDRQAIAPKHIAEGQAGASVGQKNLTHIVLNATIPDFAHFSAVEMMQLRPKVSLQSFDGSDSRIVHAAISSKAADSSADWRLVVDVLQALDPGTYRLRVHFFSDTGAGEAPSEPLIDIRSSFKVAEKKSAELQVIQLNKARVFRYKSGGKCAAGGPLLSGRVVASDFPSDAVASGNRLQLVLLGMSAGIDFKFVVKNQDQGKIRFEYTPTGPLQHYILGSTPINLSADGFFFSLPSRRAYAGLITPVVVTCPMNEAEEKCAARAFPFSVSHLSISGKWYHLVPKNGLFPACGDKDVVYYLYDFNKELDLANKAIPEEVRYNAFDFDAFSSF